MNSHGKAIKGTVHCSQTASVIINGRMGFTLSHLSSAVFLAHNVVYV